ncbi:MAG: hypothetical protein J1D77_08645 [Muribaculaceae bacterium]|nr:hypothetical protein [Muribaculaceae bacterium]
MEKPIKKTYGARGLLEWKLALNVGGAIVKIYFSGGSMGTNGVIPAKYSTESPAIQKMIEASEHFSTGKIFLIPSRPETLKNYNGQ